MLFKKGVPRNFTKFTVKHLCQIVFFKTSDAGLRFFQEEVSFLRKELDNEQKIIDNLLNIKIYMHTSSSKSSERFYKNMNAQPVQIKGAEQPSLKFWPKILTTYFFTVTSTHSS